MPKYTTADIRNLALAGHSGCGKTTLTEALLQKAGSINSVGSVEKGSTVADFDPMEHEMQHSLDSAITHMDWDGVHINLIDTPGLPDFRGPALAAINAVETAAIVVDAQSGIEFTTERMMQRATERKLCRLIIVNKIDVEETDLEGLVRDLREAFGDVCLPINLPADNGNKVVDVFFRSEGEADIFSVDAAHTEIIDQVVEVDEDLMAEYLEAGTIDPNKLHDAFEEALRQGHLVPICFVSAQTGAGLQQLLNLTKRLLPSPAEGNPPPFEKGSGESAKPVEARPATDAHAIAHVFKITNDPFVGKLSVFRIYQGEIDNQTQLYMGEERKPFKVNHLFRLQGKDHEEIDVGIAGDICAVAKVDEIGYDQVLHDSHDEDQYHLREVRFPQPMFGLAIEPVSRGHEQKLSTALHKLREEDPCFAVDHNPELNETVIRGLGELHLRTMLERMQQRFNVKVESRPPRIAYRETISQEAEGHSRHKKQTGGAGQFGEVFLKVVPLSRGEGFRFTNKVTGGSIPTNLIPAVEKGVREVLDQGAVAGYPLQDVEVIVFDGKHHPVDSKEVAFMAAGKKAFLDAIGKARPVVLEPIVSLEATVPPEHMGDLTGSLASKRARIQGSEARKSGRMRITAQVPLAELSDFNTELKSITGGEGRYTMELSHYDPAPGSVQKELAAAFHPVELE